MFSHYRLHGLRLRLGSEHPVVQEKLRRVLRYKGAEPLGGGDDADIRLAFDVCASPDSPPKTGRHLGTSRQCGIDVWEASEQVFLCHKNAIVAVHPDAGRADGQVHPALPLSKDCFYDVSAPKMMLSSSIHLPLRPRKSLLLRWTFGNTPVRKVFLRTTGLRRHILQFAVVFGMTRRRVFVLCRKVVP
jgi:hypothetical protein